MNEASCPADDLLSRFLSESLDDAKRDEVDAHIAGCSRCQSQLDGLTESHFGSTLPDEVAEDPALSRIISKLTDMAPAMSVDAKAATASGIRFPGEPTDQAPLGKLGKYAIKELVGDGSSGLLYRAVDETLDREVAIKVLRSELAGQDEFRHRLDREARAVGSLQHANVVQLFELGSEDGFPPYLVMEFVNGESLSEQLRRDRPLAPREAARITVQIAHALAQAHEKKLVHRDVKPSNILMDADHNRAKITDFGLALLDDGNSNLTREGSLAGTPAYISPEQIIDPHNVDGRSDVYSLGVVFYQLLTGELPFQGVVRMTLLAVLHQDPKSPRQLNDAIPRDLETVCLKAMAKSADKRYQSANAFADDLERWLEDRPIEARPVGRIERFSRWCKRNRMLASLSAAVAGLLLIVTVGSVIASVQLNKASTKANAAAKIANQQRDQALGTLNRLVFEVNEQFEDPEVDVDVIQKSVLDISLKGLTEVADTADGAGLTDLSTAAAHSRLGLVLGRLGRFQEAEDHLNKADKLLEQLGGENAGRWPIVKSVIEARWNRSDTACENENYGRGSDLLTRAVALARTASARWPDDFEVRMTLAMALKLLADDQDFHSDLTATENYSAAEAIYAELETEDPSNTELRREILDCLDQHAYFFYTEEMPKKAIPRFNTVIERCKRYIKQKRGDYETVSILLNAHVSLSGAYEELENNAAAIAELHKAQAAANEYEGEVDFEIIDSIVEKLRELDSGD